MRVEKLRLPALHEKQRQGSGIHDKMLLDSLIGGAEAADPVGRDILGAVKPVTA